MIAQYFSNTNEDATVTILQKNLKLSKALMSLFNFAKNLEPKYFGMFTSKCKIAKIFAFLAQNILELRPCLVSIFFAKWSLYLVLATEMIWDRTTKRR